MVLGLGVPEVLALVLGILTDLGVPELLVRIFGILALVLGVPKHLALVLGVPKHLALVLGVPSICDCFPSH